MLDEVEEVRLGLWDALGEEVPLPVGDEEVEGAFVAEVETLAVEDLVPEGEAEDDTVAVMAGEPDVVPEEGGEEEALSVACPVPEAAPLVDPTALSERDGAGDREEEPVPLRKALRLGDEEYEELPEGEKERIGDKVPLPDARGDKEALGEGEEKMLPDADAELMPEREEEGVKDAAALGLVESVLAVDALFETVPLQEEGTEALCRALAEPL